MDYPVIPFAQEELDKYLKKLNVQAQISLGLFDEFGIEMALKDPYRDDAYVISVKDRKGFIAGSNKRSVLLGVYRLLEEWGITWVRPGPNGTHYPKTCTAPDVEIREAAHKRHRIMCIEGAVSIENVLDMIEWIPKVGFNGYYIQFTRGHEFFERWYTHQLSTVKEPAPYTIEQSDKYVALMTKEIKKRGLLLHRMGHGWNCLAYGVPDHGWHEYKYEDIPQEFHDACALVNGERKCWNNRPMETQLCYSNPVVHSKIVNTVLKYAEEHPETDVIYFWLGDWWNNTCECDACMKVDPYSAHYINMINSIGDKLAEKGLKTQIVFSIGTNRAWPPHHTEIKHPDNMIMMFAPITRTYGESFPDRFRVTTLPEYKHNGFVMPITVDDNLAYLHAWEQVYHGDTVDFDYHLMWDHILDAGGEDIARVAHEDIKNFDNLGMNGFISCQLQRNAFPSSIGMTSIGKTLWNHNIDFETMRRSLYAATFGEDAVDTLCEYFSTLSKGFDNAVIRRKKELHPAEFRANLEAAIKAMDEIQPYIELHLNVEDPCQRDSWKYLAVHRQIYTVLGQSFLTRMDRDYDKEKELRRQSQHVAFENEDIVQPVLDCMYYAHVTNTRIGFLNPELSNEITL